MDRFYTATIAAAAVLSVFSWSASAQEHYSQEELDYLLERLEDGGFDGDFIGDFSDRLRETHELTSPPRPLEFPSHCMEIPDEIEREQCVRDFFALP